MLQKGISPSLAMPAEKVTACPSAMPTSKARLGMAFIMMLSEQPVGMAGVTPTILGLACASSTNVSPKTSWYLGGSPVLLLTCRSPVAGLNLPGACQMVAAFALNGVQVKQLRTT